MSNYLLGKFIRERRKSLDMSLRDFGNMCNISHTTIDCIEKGYDPRTGKAVNITNNTLGKLSAALNVPIARLVELSQGVEQPVARTSEIEVEKPADDIGALSKEELDYIRWFREEATEKEKALVRMIVEGK
ncbi:helix-turn-helix domain-containing protein [Pseudoflavonifractor phocaeensis]|uniref:helix-turn-helix domain-containing protein n=1 Tax=Pseudoflavonifractor phocaeensis TaxID=1870988 RepID=UPI00195E666B|nr:helix-turn-helix transcriptional regulator [Pseudoflavonifractor phocaeensis]MBM6871182.1 helix-turn-helix transcriptional regulator [Pseudoflavonifractor phocaeensis]